MLEGEIAPGMTLMEYVFGGVVASLLGFLLMFPFQGKSRKGGMTRNAEIKGRLSKSAECGSGEACEGSSDVIVVGAGVAGSALACALGKVRSEVSV